MEFEYPLYKVEEKLGIWNYTDDKGKTYTFDNLTAQRIYTYIKDTLIAFTNDKANSFSKSYYEFDVPENLLTVKTRQLQKITVRYFKQISNSAMSVYSEIDKDFVIMNIRISVKNPMFKSTCLHELKHIWHYSFRKSHFLNPVKNTILDDTYFEFTRDVKYITYLVYRFDPTEQQAYNEQVYQTAYSYTITGSRFHDTRNMIWQSSYLTYTKLFNYIMDNPDEDVQFYVIGLFLYNLSAIAGLSHHYKLFSNKLYKHKYVQELSEYASEIILKTGKREKAVDYVHYKITTIQDDYPELAKEILDTFRYNINNYIYNYKEYIDKVIYAGYSDANEQMKEKLSLSEEMCSMCLHNFISYYDDNIFGIEIVVKDQRIYKEKIFTLKSRDIDYSMFLKFSLLKDYLEDNSCSVEFLHKQYVKLVYKKYKYPINCLKLYQEHLHLKPFKTLDDVDDILEQLLNIEEDEILNYLI